MTVLDRRGAGARMPVLRGVPLHGKPLALIRPSPPGPSAAAAGQEPAQAAPDASQRQAFERGLEQGRLEGRESAREQALETARTELDTERARQREVGYAEGLARARQDAQADLERLRGELQQQASRALAGRARQLEEAASAMRERARDLLARAEDEIVAIVHEALCRLLAQSAVSPDVVLALVRRLAAESSLADPIAVHLHPDDHRALLALLPEQQLGGFTWVPDADVALGGVVLHGAAAGLDARLDLQLQALRQALLAARRARPAAAGAGEAAPADDGDHA